MSATVHALVAVSKERDRQEELILAGRIPWNCADPSIADDKKLAVLVEEVGEVARAMLEGTYRPDQLEALLAEVVQVAAVAVAWVEALQAEMTERRAA